MSNSAAPRRSRTDLWLPAGLFAVAGLGWWWSVVSATNMRSDAMPMDAQSTMPMAGQSTMSFTGFLVAWIAMMAAMMLPAILPVVRRYAHAVDGKTGPVAIFVAGYLAVWSMVGVPAYFAWRLLDEPLTHADPWAGRLAGAVAVVAGLYQLTPLKGTSLQHCRSPMFFLPTGAHLDRAARAAVAGGRHGIACLASCWLLMALLIAFGTMHLAWMLALTVLIWLERVTPFGDRLTRVTAALLALLGAVLLVHPAFISYLA